MNTQIGIYDHLTGEQIVRDMTAEELAHRDVEIAKYLADKEAQELAAAELRATKVAAYEKLGLTEAEIEALLPTSAELKHNI